MRVIHLVIDLTVNQGWPFWFVIKATMRVGASHYIIQTLGRAALLY